MISSLWRLVTRSLAFCSIWALFWRGRTDLLTRRSEEPPGQLEGLDIERGKRGKIRRRTVLLFTDNIDCV